MKLFKIFAVLSLVVLGLSQTAGAALIVTVDIGNNGSVEGTTSDGSSPYDISLSTSSGGITVNLDTHAFENALAAGINTTQAAISLTGSGSGQVRIKVLYEDLSLPAGDPLDVTSTIASSTLFGGITGGSNSTYIDDVISLNTTTGAVTFANAPTAVMASMGPSPVGTQSVTASRDRGGATYSLLSDILLNYDLTALTDFTGNAVADSVVVAPIPEAGSLIAWSLCAAAVGIVVYRRKRTA